MGWQLTERRLVLALEDGGGGGGGLVLLAGLGSRLGSHGGMPVD
jgi:hypothetical protein